MRYRILGRTGVRVSEVGFGGAPLGIPNYIEAWTPDAEAERQSAIAAARAALDHGVNYFDTAPGYGAGTSERLLGEALEGQRARCFLATKCPIGDGDSIRRGVEASLRNLRTGCLDLVQFHGGWYSPQETRRVLDEGLPALRRLRDEGLVRFIGFTAEGPSGGVSQLIATGEFDVLQVRFNLMYGHTCDFVNEAGVMREAEAKGMGIVTMRTLTSGIFQKLFRRLCPEASGRVDIDAFLLNYVLSNPLVDVALVGMRRPEEAARNAAVSDDAASRLDLAALHHRFADR